ncbi:hypothetical protein MKW98_022323 [Papaver atlanticum]|uniref:Uncharacterized protein n=1 Tax=Papaver atlanticum TaxID=357466 RepID=A0AAD4T431_9MAGN|nr:hypothetical protein MKW98_022323 [Papaver atlanticum]
MLKDGEESQGGTYHVMKKLISGIDERFCLHHQPSKLTPGFLVDSLALYFLLKVDLCLVSMACKLELGDLKGAPLDTIFTMPNGEDNAKALFFMDSC